MLEQTITLPEQLTMLCLDVFQKIALSERDFIRQVVELVNGLLDADYPAEEIKVRELYFIGFFES